MQSPLDLVAALTAIIIFIVHSVLLVDFGVVSSKVLDLNIE